jgi:hypothetical protein
MALGIVVLTKWPRSPGGVLARKSRSPNARDRKRYPTAHPDLDPSTAFLSTRGSETERNFSQKYWLRLAPRNHARKRKLEGPKVKGGFAAGEDQQLS